MIYFCGPNNLFTQQVSPDFAIEYLSKYDILALDTETQGRDPHTKKIISLQLSAGDGNEFVIDTRYVNILKFKALIESKLIIGHNLKFDYKFLRNAGIILNKIYDTFITETIIYTGYTSSNIHIGYGLDKVCARYCGVTLSKETRGDFFKITSEPFSEKQIEYAALDVKYLHQIRMLQILKLIKYDLLYCSDLENEVVKALADMEYNGLLLDTNAWRKLATEANQKLINLEVELDKIVVNELAIISQLTLFENERLLSINYNSSAQVLQILQSLGIVVNDTSNRTLKKQRTHEFVKKLLEHRTVAKKFSTYGENFLDSINSKTKRVHTEFRQIVDTGRIASGRKKKKGDFSPATPNLQNIPRENEYRNCFKAQKGYKWISGDYSQQELVIMGEGAEQYDFIETYNSGGDLHCFVGSLMFNKTITEKDKELRTQAKTVNFGKAYGMGPSKLSDTLEIDTEEAINLIKKHERALPKISAWLNKLGLNAVRKGYSRTFYPCNRVRWYPHYKKNDDSVLSEIQRQGGNSPIQGTGADMCKEALVNIRNLVLFYNKMYGENTAQLLCTVHDQIDVEVKEGYESDFANDMQKVMQEAAAKYLKVAKMRVDITISNVWQK